MSRRTVFRLIEHGVLAKYRRAGDKKTYVSREQLTRAAGFREVAVEYDAQSRRPPGMRGERES
jgi:hypothetical protein